VQEGLVTRDATSSKFRVTFCAHRFGSISKFIEYWQQHILTPTIGGSAFKLSTGIVLENTAVSGTVATASHPDQVRKLDLYGYVVDDSPFPNKNEGGSNRPSNTFNTQADRCGTIYAVPMEEQTDAARVVGVGAGAGVGMGVGVGVGVGAGAAPYRKPSVYLGFDGDAATDEV
jgi:hypothetical protein